MKSITRRRAREKAMECIQKQMRPLAFGANVAENDPNAPPVMQRQAEEYAELAAALAWLETASRQKEMHL